MKKYFVTSDVHSAYDELMEALNAKGFDINNDNHYLIICGDLFDRKNGTRECYQFALQLADKKRLIYIKGNHELLLHDCVKSVKYGYDIGYHHISNGTTKTIAQLTGESEWVVFDPDMADRVCEAMNPVLKFIDDNSVFYFELGDYLFVHSWVPVRHANNLQEASIYEWEQATWGNPYELAQTKSWCPEGKTVVFGHFHTSWARKHLHNEDEWGEDANFDVYYGDNYIALDSCVAYTDRLNCIVFEEDDQGVVKLLDKNPNL